MCVGGCVTGTGWLQTRWWCELREHKAEQGWTRTKKGREPTGDWNEGANAGWVCEGRE